MTTRIQKTILGAAFIAAAALPVLAGETFTIPTAEERARVLGIGNRPAPEPAPWSNAEAALLIGQNDFDVTHYFLDLNFDESTRRISGSVTMTATSRVASLQHVILDLHSAMIVSSVLRGASVLSFTRTGALLDVTLDVPAASGESFAITVTYAGSPSTGTYFGWNKYFGGIIGQMVWSLSEPSGARIWWPCKDRPDDKATVEEWWTVKSGWTATGNGVLQGVDTVGTRQRYRWVATHPMPTYLVSVAATNYSTFSDSYTTLTGGTMPLQHYVYSEYLSAAQTSFSTTPQMIAYYAGLFGEYPFVEDKYGMSAFPFSGAMEHSTNTSYGYTLINGGHQYDYVIAHELSHQWWGDSVSPETWSDIWLNEGFASYSEALWAEHLGGSSAYRSYMGSLYSSSFSGPVYGNLNAFGATVYDKGGWVQHMLRGVLGDVKFFDALRAWYAGNKDGVGNTARYQQNAEAVYAASLDWFFEEWVYGLNMPTYQYGFRTANLGGGQYRTYVQIKQTQTNAGTFTMPIDLTLVTSGGNQARRVWNDASDQDFVLDTTAPVSSITFDPSNWILKTGVTAISLPDADADGVPDRNDNCPSAANAQQLDTDHDSSGDACDLDDDNDQLPDATDCAPADATQGRPAEVALVTMSALGGGAAALAWTPDGLADTYDVSRGAVADLPTGYGACLVSGVSSTQIVDPDVPLPGEAFEYLVRGVDAGCGGAGSAGFDSSGAPRAICP